MRKIEVSESTFSQLQELAKPLVDNAETVIIRLISHYRNNTSGSTTIAKSCNKHSESDDIDLKFTSVLSASIDGEEVAKAKWIVVLRKMVGILITERGLSPEDIGKDMGTWLTKGSHNKRGFHPVKGAGVSIQNKPANDTWNKIRLLASKHNCPVEISFQWQDYEHAYRPGEEGTIKAP